MNLFRRLLGIGSAPAAEPTIQQAPLSDAECEYYFLQLLDGIGQEWDRVKVDRFFQALRDRASDERWLAWLRRFGNARLSEDSTQAELGRRLVQFSQTSSRHFATVAGEIGRQLLARPEAMEVSESPVAPALAAPTPTPESAPVTRSVVDEAEVQRWVKRGMEQLDLDRYEAALLAFDRALALDDRQVRALIGRADALADLQRSQAALETYQKVLELDPNNAEAWGRLGDLQHELKRPEAAIESWDKALELDPKDVQTWINKGVALGLRLGRWQDALAAWDKALELDPKDAQIWFRRGVAFGAMEQWDAAVESWDKTLELDPYFRDAWINKGVALQKLGRYEEAIEANNRALGLDVAKAEGVPAEPSKAKDPQPAEASSMPERAEDFYRKSIEQYDSGNLHAALRFLDRAVEADPDNLQAWQQRGQVQRELGQFEASIISCDRVLATQPDDVKTLWTRALALQQLQRWEAANTAWDKVLEQQPDVKDAWIHKGIALEKLGRYGEAIEANKRAM
ncbi:MAG: tetratricopeptide repeat protein [Cyanobacteria bacterium SBC]|nr:tetratricopeptide repeat protein [Cyanobacteria bacterium SBC]